MGNILIKISSIIFIVVIFSADLYAQAKIIGQIKDDKGKVLPFASIYIENTIDGTTTDSLGRYSFKTRCKGKQVIVVSSIGYELKIDTISIEGNNILHNMTVKEKSVSVEEVVITAGAFAANDDQKVAILKPLDIYTNAGAGGDIMGAIRTLPGAQPQSDQTGLFVRGGDASESVVIIDGMVVQNPFGSNVPGISSRSRFMPFQFRGISFSSGGYSARYGQALSSVLELNTFNLPEQSTLNYSMGLSGIEFSAVKKINNSAFELTGHYDNLSPFFSFANTNYHFYAPPVGGGFSGKYTLANTDRDLLKVFLKYDIISSGTDVPNPFTFDTTQFLNLTDSIIPFGLKNYNLYFNSSYSHIINKLILRTAISASNNIDNLNWGPVPGNNKDWRLQWRGEGSFIFSEKTNLLIGSEIQRYQYNEGISTYNSEFNELIVAGYAELEWKPQKWFAIKPGFRYEYSQLLERYNAAPRLSLAIGTGKYSQVSFAGGLFYENPDNKYLLSGYHLNFQEATHYIGNYQWIKNDRTFRFETYYKSYNQLVMEKLNSNVPYDGNPYRFVFPGENIDNSGYGYAKGLEIFWRDKALMHNFDYWLSYSYIDTKRLYDNYKAFVTPGFVSNNNLNLIVKYFIEPLQVNIGASYTYATGRPSYNPDFQVKYAPDYSDLALNLSYLTTIGKVFGVAYISVDNVTNRKNIFGYQISLNGTPNPIEPPIYRYIYAGFTISLTQFKKEEL